MAWSIWKSTIKKSYKEISKSDIKKYLDNCIFKPYLIHIEFEVLNLLTTIQIDKILRKIIHQKGISIITIEVHIKRFLEKIQQLIDILKF